jgi:hypothetical protein
MADQEKRGLGIENLEVSELEDQDLEDVTGGVGDTNTCPITNNNCPCPSSPVGQFGTLTPV